MLKKKITAADIFRELPCVVLRDLALEVQEWHKTGKTDGVHLAAFSANLIRDAGLSEDGIYQVAESLILQEVCDRWINSKRLEMPLTQQPRRPTVS